MSGTRPVQSPAAGTAAAGLAFAVGLIVVLLGHGGIVALSGPLRESPAHPAIRETAFGTFLCWAIGFPVAYARRNRGGAAGPLAVARIAYAAGCAMCLLHIAVAFHLAHGWSHRAAFDHVERISGFGPGLYVNYLFAAVWLLDAAWAAVSFDSYRSRPRWLNRAVHGFMAFVMFNAAVVFNTRFSGAICALFFVALAVQTWKEWRRGDETSRGGNERTRPGAGFG